MESFDALMATMTVYDVTSGGRWPVLNDLESAFYPLITTLYCAGLLLMVLRSAGNRVGPEFLGGISLTGSGKIAILMVAPMVILGPTAIHDAFVSGETPANATALAAIETAIMLMPVFAFWLSMSSGTLSVMARAIPAFAATLLMGSILHYGYQTENFKNIIAASGEKFADSIADYEARFATYAQIGDPVNVAKDSMSTYRKIYMASGPNIGKALWSLRNDGDVSQKPDLVASGDLNYTIVTIGGVLSDGSGEAKTKIVCQYDDGDLFALSVASIFSYSADDERLGFYSQFCPEKFDTKNQVSPKEGLRTILSA